jgi:hypothetical protein
MSKQTAVEWLRTIYENRPAYEEFILDEEWEQAKEMEKEQIVKAVSKGWNYHEDGFVSWMGEQYYNETYGGNK